MIISPEVQQRLIESYYEPDQLVTAQNYRRLGGAILDTVIVLFTLFIGWFIWFCIVAGRGQTPGKQLLGMYVIRENGLRSGGAFMFFVRQLLVKDLLFSLLGALTGGILWLLAALWCLWDHERQCLWDKVSHTYVGYSPNGFRPLTVTEVAEELRLGNTPPGSVPRVARDKPTT